MENKNNHLSPKPLFLILFILIEVLVVLILPFRFVSASVILLMNLWGVRYWLKMKRWLILNKREKIQQASAQSISIENQRSKWINRGRIARYFFYCKRKKEKPSLSSR